MKKNTVLLNLFWQILDKVILLVLQFFVGVKIANYFGKEVYGVYSYALSLVIFSEIIYELFNKRIIILYFLKRKNIKILKIASYFKTILSVVFLITIIISKHFFEDINLYLILILLSFSIVFKNMTFFYEVYYEATLNSKPFVLIVNIIKIISYISQYIIIIFYKNIIFIPLIMIIENIIKVIFLKIFFYQCYNTKNKIRKIKYKYLKVFIINIIKKSFYFWIGYIYFLVFTQIDKIMIGNMMDKSEVGIYSIAVQLTNVLAIIILPIQNTLYPVLLREKNKEVYIKKWQYFNTLITYFYLIITLLSFPVLKYSFSFVFSKEYSEAIYIYYLLSISVFLKANACLRMSYITLFNLGNLIVKLSITGIILNISLNYFFIKNFGIRGAAVATVITQFLTGNILYSLFKNGKIITKIQLNSLDIRNFWRKNEDITFGKF